MESIVVTFDKKISQFRKESVLEPLRRRPSEAQIEIGSPSPQTSDLDSEFVSATKFETADLSLTERAELDRSPEHLVAQKMELALHQPLGVYSSHPPFIPADSANASWGIGAVGADDTAYDGAGVKVAVLDTGIDGSHPAFTGVNLTTKNFSNDQSVDEDIDGHGTHCAGTIFGRDVNGTRIGVARGITEAFIAKVLPGGTDALIKAMTWAFDNDVRVASMSLGIDFPGFVNALVYQRGMDVRAATSIALTEYRANLAIFDTLLATFEARQLMGRGMVIAAATGNESRRNQFTIDVAPPAAAKGIIPVGAAEYNGSWKIADFSNTKPLMVAPGVNIESAALGGGLVAMSGTSMATPHVAGLAALYWQAANPNANASNVAAQIQANAINIGLPWNDGGVGLATTP